MRVQRLVVAMTSFVGLLGLALPAVAAGDTQIYLTGNGEPVAAMTFSAPPGGGLPNYDPDRDSQPGLYLARSGKGVDEDDPTKHQDWVYDASGTTISAAHLVIWAASKDFDQDKNGRFSVYVMDCGSSCVLLREKKVSVAGSSSWTRVTVAAPVNNQTFASGHSLVVRIVVENNSDDDMWFAYGTSTYDAHLRLSQPPETPTTTSTTTTTTTPTTTHSTSTTTSTTPGNSPGNGSGNGPGNGPGGPQPGPGGGGPPGESPPHNAGGGANAAGQATTTTPTGDVTGTTVALGSIPPLFGGGDDGDPGSTTDLPTTIEEPTPVVFAAQSRPVVAEMFETSRDLRPAEGLMVAFATVAESVELYWQAAVALGSVAAGLLWSGLSGKHEWQPGAARGASPRVVWVKSRGAGRAR